MPKATIKIVLAIIIAVTSSCGSDDEAIDPDDVGAAEEAIVGGTTDFSTPAANAVVQVNGVLVSGNFGSCTGTLITEDVVLTAGHCFATHSTPPPSGVPVNSGTCDWEVPGQWYSFPNQWWPPPAAAVGTGNPVINFGLNSGAPTLTATAIAYSIPDCADALALLLNTDVPRSVAVPANVVLRQPDLTSIANVDVAGYGLISGPGTPNVPTTTRQFASINGPLSTNCPDPAPEHVCVTNNAQGTRPGDSGGPIFISGTRDLIGIGRQSSAAPPPGSTWTSTYVDARTTGNPQMPNVAPWLARIVDCEGFRTLPGLPLGETSPILSWWHAERGDNFLTTDSRWSESLKLLTISGEHFISGSKREGFSSYRLEGFAMQPEDPPRDGTVPLYSWWNPERGDNFATSDPRWSMDPDEIQWDAAGQHIINGPTKEGYTLYRLEGYVWDPFGPQVVGTVPLYSWWNPERGDNFATSDPRWSMDPDEIQWDAAGQHIINGPTKEGYTLYRLEGYVWDHRVGDGYCERQP